MLAYCLFPLICPFFVVVCSALDDYSEKLDFYWLKNGDYHIAFNFDFVHHPDGGHSFHSGTTFDRFPKVVSDFMKDHSVNDFHLSLTQGMWRYEQFGYPLVEANPSGAELWIWFADSVQDVDSQWELAVNSLAGFFCASLNFMSTSFSGSPEKILRPNSMFHEQLNSSSMKYSNLPSENVCTENLTPWKKLLPCETSSGFVQLLYANQLFNSKYVSLSVDAFKQCESSVLCENPELVLKLTASVVFDGYRFQDHSRSLSLLTLFHKPLGRVCPLADTTVIKSRSYKEDCSVLLSLKGASVKVESLSLTADDRTYDVNFERKCQKENETISPDPTPNLRLQNNTSPILVHKYLSSTIGNVISHF